MKEKLAKIREEILKQIDASENLDKLNEVRVSALGKKGALTELLKSMKEVAPEERPKVGQMVNEVRAEIETALETEKAKLEDRVMEARLKNEVIDVTLPAKKNSVGHRHPNTIALEEVERIFVGMGYEVVRGPEVEKDYYNFEALNIPKDHPARDEQDTFYINEEIVLRTQTSPVQVRTMEQGKLPIRMIAPGRVFRSDEVDATHSPSFHQIEGLVIDKNITFADLKGKRIAVQSTSKPEHIILSGEDDRIQGVSAVYSMSTMSELYASLRKGYIDAAAGHEVAIKRFVDTNPQQFIILDETLYKSELGVAFKKGRCDDIPDILNDILKQMIDDGTIKKIAESYGINADISMGDN